MRWPPALRQAVLARLRWIVRARPEQLTPPGEWRTWLILAGRGWGKTRTGAEDLAYFAQFHPRSRCAVVAPTFADARDTCVEGESGLLAVLPGATVRQWNRSLGELRLWNGSLIRLYSADRPDRLRGPQHHRAWADEVAAWSDSAALDQLQFGLRLGPQPQLVLTTTPRPLPWLEAMLARAGDDVVLSRGPTFANRANLAPAVLAGLRARYAGTWLGQQELEGEIVRSVPSALWHWDDFAAWRVTQVPPLQRRVLAIDPAVSHGPESNETGMILAGLGDDDLAYVLGDYSARLPPEQWARRAIDIVQAYEAEKIVVEVNEGGALVEQLLRLFDGRVPVQPVRAIRSKTQRALPVAALYAQGRVRHVGALRLLEDQLCRFVPERGLLAGGAGSSTSPDRLDALVYALTELLLGEQAVPRLRHL